MRGRRAVSLRCRQGAGPRAFSCTVPRVLRRGTREPRSTDQGTEAQRGRPARERACRGSHAGSRAPRPESSAPAERVERHPRRSVCTGWVARGHGASCVTEATAARAHEPFWGRPAATGPPSPPRPSSVPSAPPSQNCTATRLGPRLRQAPAVRPPLARPGRSLGRPPATPQGPVGWTRCPVLRPPLSNRETEAPRARILCSVSPTVNGGAGLHRTQRPELLTAELHCLRVLALLIGKMGTPRGGGRGLGSGEAPGSPPHAQDGLPTSARPRAGPHPAWRLPLSSGW